MTDEFERWELLNNALKQSRRDAHFRVERFSTWRNGDTLKDFLVRAIFLNPTLEAMAEKAVQMSADDANEGAVEKSVNQLFALEKKYP